MMARSGVWKTGVDRFELPRLIKAILVGMVLVSSPSSVLAHPHPYPFVLTSMFEDVLQFGLHTAYFAILGLMVVSLFAGWRAALSTWIPVVLLLGLVMGVDAVFQFSSSNNAAFQECGHDFLSCTWSLMIEWSYAVVPISSVWFCFRRLVAVENDSAMKRVWHRSVQVFCLAAFLFTGFLMCVAFLDALELVPFYSYTVTDSEHIH